MGLKPSGWEFKHKKSDSNLAFAVSKLESVYTCSCAHLHTCIPLCSSFISKGLKMIILPSRVLSMFSVGSDSCLWLSILELIVVNSR